MAFLGHVLRLIRHFPSFLGICIGFIIHHIIQKRKLRGFYYIVSTLDTNSAHIIYYVDIIF